MMIQRLRNWWWQRGRMLRVETDLVHAMAIIEEQHTRLASAQAQINSWQQQDREQRNEIQRLIREVGTLESHLGRLGETPVTIRDDGPGQGPMEKRQPDPEIPAPEFQSFRAAARKRETDRS